MRTAYLEDEIRRAYRVLEPEAAESQNAYDIHCWMAEGYIDGQQADQLIQFNRMMYRQTR